MTKTLVTALLALVMTMHSPAPPGFGDDVEFLKSHTRVLLLGRGDAQVAVCPAYQGRVMTSTASGPSGLSLGWIHREHIGAGQLVPHINVFGGEDRFWIGPEGGQYSVFFKAGDPFDLDHWQTPEAIDWGSWDVADRSASGVRFRKRMTLVNHSRTSLDIDVDRAVRVLTDAEAAADLGAAPPSAVRMVAYESSNTIENAGRKPWQPDTGLVSVWILGMFNPSPETTIAVPFASGPEAERGPIVNDAYFGKVP